MTREAFLLRSTLAAGAAYGALSATGLVARALGQDGGGGDDVDVVNYALTLEYLEAAFYTAAVRRVGGLSSDELRLARTLRDNETAHVDALTATVTSLGGTPAARPTFDFGTAFADRDAFLKTANALEDTGVSAYNGAAATIESRRIVQALAGIVQVEARHAALVRLARDKPAAPLSFDKESKIEEVLASVAQFVKA
ncbi:MAG TPA: ferritin-like domain-containing protein [Solirubrobacteraceae bacterium]|nr:ferritin-like domain-containing protein [Solirubrobacteraceae bacterium]